MPEESIPAPERGDAATTIAIADRDRTDALLLDDPPQTKWPTVIGLISLIYGLIGLTCVGFTVAGPQVQSFLMRTFGVDVELPPMPPAMQMQMIVSAIVGVILTALLLSGAVSLLRRSRRAAMLMKAWVFARLTVILLAIAMVVLTLDANVRYQLESRAAVDAWLIENDRPPQPAIDEAGMRGWTIALTLGVSALQAVYPIFIGVWFSRRKIRDEVAQWR